MKRSIFFILLLFVGTTIIAAKSFTDISPVDVDVGIECTDQFDFVADQVNFDVLSVEDCPAVQFKWPTLATDNNTIEAHLWILTTAEGMNRQAINNKHSYSRLNENDRLVKIPTNIANEGLSCLSPEVLYGRAEPLIS